MPDTVAGLFPTRSQAETALRNLKDAGFADDRLSVSTPPAGRRGHYMQKHIAGLLAGGLAGAIAGVLLAVAVGSRMPGNRLGVFAFLIVCGAATGGVAGGLISMAASGDRTLHYEQEVEAGRYLVTVAGPDGLVEARRILRASGAMESEPVEAPLRPESG